MIIIWVLFVTLAAWFGYLLPKGALYRPSYANPRGRAKLLFNFSLIAGILVSLWLRSFVLICAALLVPGYINWASERFETNKLAKKADISLKEKGSRKSLKGTIRSRN